VDKYVVIFDQTAEIPKMPVRAILAQTFIYGKWTHCRQGKEYRVKRMSKGREKQDPGFL